MTRCIDVHPGGRRVSLAVGPRLLSGVLDGPGLAAHRARFPTPAREGVDEVAATARTAGLLGRGGAGFPFADKLEATAVARGGPVVVVNLSEGEPASWKDAALAQAVPHLVLDGAAVAGHALGARRAHVVVAGDRPRVGLAVRRAVAERGRQDPLRWSVHTAEPGFVSGQSRAVVELLSGRRNLPVTSWRPTAEDGVRGRPTLLSNAETFAALAAATAHGPAAARTRLLTLHGDGTRPRVVEASEDDAWSTVLDPDERSRPVLLGGYHGSWAAAGALDDVLVSEQALAARGLRLGAGVVLPLAPGDCPLHRTARLAAYLADQSARRCGPCRNGLPALAAVLAMMARGCGGRAELDRLLALVDGRGACAHPDGTARLVRSLLRVAPEEPARHASGTCSFGPEPSYDATTTRHRLGRR